MMKKLLIATLIGCTTLCSMQVSAKAKSFSEKDLVGTWQCEVKSPNNYVSYTTEYRNDNTAIDIGQFKYYLKNTVLSYDVSISHRYSVVGNQLKTISKTEYFLPRHNPKVQDNMIVKQFDEAFQKMVRQSDGVEYSTTILELSQDKLILVDDLDDNVTCQRIE